MNGTWNSLCMEAAGMSSPRDRDIQRSLPSAGSTRSDHLRKVPACLKAPKVLLHAARAGPAAQDENGATKGGLTAVYSSSRRDRRPAPPHPAIGAGRYERAGLLGQEGGRDVTERAGNGAYCPCRLHGRIQVRRNSARLASRLLQFCADAPPVPNSTSATAALLTPASLRARWTETLDAEPTGRSVRYPLLTICAPIFRCPWHLPMRVAPRACIGKTSSRMIFQL